MKEYPFFFHLTLLKTYIKMHRQEIFPLLSRRGIEGEVNQTDFMKNIFYSNAGTFIQQKVNIFFCRFFIPGNNRLLVFTIHKNGEGLFKPHMGKIF